MLYQNLNQIKKYPKKGLDLLWIFSDAPESRQNSITAGMRAKALAAG